jgi:transketolase
MADNAVLQAKATEIRKHIVTMLCKSQSGHPGGSLSAADIVSYLYFEEMNIDPANPKDANRDRFILSKGHAAPVLYATLAEKGFIEKESLMTLREYGSKLQGHPDMKKVSGVEISTGSLGQGLSVANGMALAGKMSNLDYNVFILMGDGEIQEGQVWEAAMTSAHYNLDRVIAFVDLNGLQIDGNTKDVMNVGSVADKFRAFNWNVIEIDGHNFDEIREAVQKAKATEGKPTCIVANTVKGKGVDFMENVCGFHGVAPTVEQTEQAIEQLEKVERMDV